MKIKFAILILSLSFINVGAQNLVFFENMGSPTTNPTSIAANSFLQIPSYLSYSNGAQPGSADVRNTLPSSTYTGYSAGGNVYFTSSTNFTSYGFSIEGINASNYSSLSLQFGYKKELNGVHATFSVDYWNGSSWTTLANSSSSLFYESSTTLAGWFLSKSLPLPVDAQINGLKIRFVKSGSTAIRIDDVKLTGTEIPPTVSTTAVTSITSNSAYFAGNVTATGGSTITATGTVYSPTATNANPILAGSNVITISTSSPNSGTGTFSDSSGTVLLPNVQYSYNAYATKSTALTGYGTVATFYTLAVIPVAPSITNATGNSLNITLGSDTNSSLTTYSLFETTTSTYVQSNGSLGGSAVYQTAAAWGTKTVTGLSPTTAYTFEVRAKNGDGIITLASSSVSITTLEQPSITVSGTLAALSTIYGTASSFTSFTVSAINLTDNILVTAPIGFEISKTAGGTSGYASSQTITPSLGTVSLTTIYVRLAANSPFGNYMGDVVVRSINDGITQNVAIPSSSVAKLSLTISGITANNKVYDTFTTATLSGIPQLNGVLASESSNVGLSTTVTANFNDATIGDGKPVTVIYTLTGSAAFNYSLIQPAGLTANITPNNASDVILNTSSTTSTNEEMNYWDYQGTTLSSTSNSNGVIGFRVRDGGALANDADNLATELTAITFRVTNAGNLRYARIFVVNSPKGSAIPVPAPDVNGVSILTFTGLTGIAAQDNDDLAVHLRVTFNSTVTDNEQMQFQIVSVTAKSTGSQFAVADGGGAISPLSPTNVNRILVTADRLQFVQQPPLSLYEDSDMSPSPTVIACDVLGNTDYDFSGLISVTSSGTLSASPQTSYTFFGVAATFDTIKHSVFGTNLQLTATYPGLISGYSNLFNIEALTIPVFDLVPPICTGDTLTPLPLTSNNGITGTWSPALDNTDTTYYLFTPDNPSQHARTAALSIVVNQLVNPVFSPVGTITPGATVSPLPLVSNNGITGTWSPPIDNTTTTLYTFTPNAGQCAGLGFITITVSSTGGGTGTTTTYPTTPTENSSEVGITEGELSVSLTGAAEYTIPIKIPPGINGVVPQVSLDYNSHSGNGLAGYGWNIGGLSKISRIPSTKFHDNVIGSVELNNQDHFALDGQRLIKKSGPTSGFEGAVYATENYSNIKITAHGQHPQLPYGGPEYFSVEYPDGSVANYGNATGNNSYSRSLAEYAITSWQNAQGIRINYKYMLINNSLYIDNIVYGTKDNVPSIKAIQFFYSTATRTEQAYVGGQSFIRDRKLSTIYIAANGVSYKYYNLLHGPTSLGYERLIGIRESTGDLSKSYNKTVFAYEDTPQTISASPVQSIVGLSNINFNNSATVQGDFDSDGKLDFLVYPTTVNNKNKFWLFNQVGQGSTTTALGPFNVGGFDSIFSSSWLNFNDKLMPMNAVTVVKNGTLVGNNTVVNFNTYSSQYSNITLQNTKAIQFPAFNVGDTAPLYNFCNYSPYKVRPYEYLNGDFNGDGITDVIAIEKSATYYKDGGCTPSGGGGWYQINGSGITTYAGNAYFVDLDRRSTQTSATFLGLINYLTNTNHKIYVADYNGDGKSDLFIFKENGGFIYTLNNDSNHLDLLLTFSDTDISIGSNRTILLGDYNGDGKTDFIVPKGYGTSYRKFLAGGPNGFVASNETYDIPFNPNSGSECPMSFYIIPTDFDLDGKTDLILAKNWACPTTLNEGYVSIRNYKNMGTNFVSDMFTNIPSTVGVGAFAIPIFLNGYNQNYNQEISFITNNKLIHFNSDKNFNKDKLLKSITTGDGVVETITYKPMIPEGCPSGYNCSSVFNNALYVETYPNYDINLSPTFQLVSKIEKQSSTVYKRKLFSYHGAVSNMEGLGFLGFRSIASTNWHNDTAPVITNVNKTNISLRGAITDNYVVSGLLSASTTIYPADPFISKTSTIYNTDVNTGIFYEPLQSDKVYKLEATTVQNFNGLNNTSQETKILYDSYNNPTQSTINVKNGTVLEKSLVTNLTYDPPTTSPYVIGRPVNKTNTTTINAGLPNQDVSVREELYQYTNNLLTQTQMRCTNSGVTTNFLTEDNIYNGFGNLTKKTITATGLTPRETNYEYDPSELFMTKSIDVEGLETQYNYNPSSGVLNFTINPYGQKTSFEYDKWYKKTKTTDYLLKNLVTTYVRDGNKSVVTSTGDDGSNTLETYDDLGRLVKKGNTNIGGTWSYSDIEYDIYDKIKKVSEPYSGTSPSQFNETIYDEFGRVIQQTSHTGEIISTTYVGLNKTISNGIKSKNIVEDASGNVTQVTDTPGGVIDYTFFANDNLKATLYNGSSITLLQDGWGRKSEITDPSTGTYHYTRNDFGQLTEEITPNGTTTLVLDNYGKLTSKTTVGPLTNNSIIYQYDPTSKKLISEQLTDIESKIYNKSYTYDADKRLSGIVENESTSQYQFEKNFEYDPFGRLNREFSKATNLSDGKNISKWIKHSYRDGYHSQIRDDSTNAILWQIDAVNPKGQLVTAHYGNSVGEENHTYNNGFPESTTYTTINGSYASTIPFMTLSNTFIQSKNRLDTRNNSMFGWDESFSYDDLDRLTGFKDINNTPTTQSYYDNGTINVNNTGTYAYNIANKPYQASTVTLPDIDNINYYTARNPQTVSYNAFRKPLSISEEGFEKIDFDYNQSSKRAIQYYGSTDIDKNNRPFRKYFSSDGTMEIKRNMTTGDVDFVMYIGGDGYSARLITKGDGTTQNYFYLHKDDLGSILAISDANGQVVEKRLFDAWGSLIRYENSSGITAIPTLTGSMFIDRGYTGHEHLFGVGLINMNARLYDPKLHRFLGADNYVHDEYDTQSLNRYGYVLNNPLSYIDPSGEDPVEGNGNGGPNPEFSGGTWANIAATIGANWDNWGIKDWSNRNLNFNKFSDGFKSAGNWASNNLKSIGNWFSRNIESMFGGSGRSNELPASPNFSNYQPNYSWMNEGFNTGGVKVSIMYSNSNASTSQGANFSQGHFLTTQNPVANYDPSGMYSVIAGEGLSLAQIKMFNAEANTWYSVWKMKTYNISTYNGNYYTGWKAGASRVSTGFKAGGYGLGVYSMYTNYSLYESDQMDGVQYGMEQTVAFISTFGGDVGAAIGIGWELGRLFTYWDPYIHWRDNFRREYLGY